MREERLREGTGAFEAIDFADWLRAGILQYYRFAHVPPHAKPADSFPWAKVYIGDNPDGLPSDLQDIFEDLLPSAKGKFRRALALIWVELEFQDPSDFRLAEDLLILACRVRARALVGVLTSALPWLAIAAEEDKDGALHVRRLAFKAAVELAAPTSESMHCLERFLSDRTGDQGVLEGGEALEITAYLAELVPEKLTYWAALFGSAIVADQKQLKTSPGDIRKTLADAAGTGEVERMIDYVRVDQPERLPTEFIALTSASLSGLRDLVASIDPVTYALARRSLTNGALTADSAFWQELRGESTGV